MKYKYQGMEVDRDKIFKFLDYIPHPTQLRVHNSNARFRILRCGRRWGKTKFASKEMVQAMCLPFKRYWCVAPTYSLAEKVYREIYYDFSTHPELSVLIESASASSMKITLKNGTVLEAKSADNPESLLGEGLDGMIIDEAALIKDEVWQRYLRPTLADKSGWLIAISTPRGLNWFHKIFQEGVEKLNGVESFHYLSSDNPYIPKGEIELARRTLPERTFQQEFLGEFLSNIGGVFRNVRQCIHGILREPEAGVKYIIGVDLAKYQDFTVIIVLDERNGQVVYFDRFNDIDWSLQEKRIIEIHRKYWNARVVIDATGVGDRVYEELSKHIRDIEGFTITGANKNELIDNLSIAIDQRKVLYPDIPELVNELNIYEYKVTESGRTTLNAPSGYHDDCVIALALAVHGQQAYSAPLNLAII